MRNPFARRPPTEREDLLSYEFRQRGYSESNHDQDMISRSQQYPAGYDWTIDPNEMAATASADAKGKKGVVRLVKKLNCGASRREREYLEDDNYYVPSPVYREKSTKSFKSDISENEEITRPVLITVRDGETPNIGKNHGSEEETNSFVVGGTPERHRGNPFSSKWGLKGKSTSKNTAGTNSGFSPARFLPRGPFQSTKSNSSPRKASRDTNDMISSQEKARKQRWLKGYEQSWYDDADVPSLVSGDESTYGCSAISGSAGTAASGDSDYSTEASSDASGYGFSAGRFVESSLGFVRASPPHRRPDTAWRSEPKGKSVWAGVADDMRIIAGMLLSDGTACVGTVAAITHETVVDSCKPQRS